MMNDSVLLKGQEIGKIYLKATWWNLRERWWYVTYCLHMNLREQDISFLFRICTQGGWVNLFLLGDLCGFSLHTHQIWEESCFISWVVAGEAVMVILYHLHFGLWYPFTVKGSGWIVSLASVKYLQKCPVKPCSSLTFFILFN